jgi:tetratricopeptide (TPR) repeat protein
MKIRNITPMLILTLMVALATLPAAAQSGYAKIQGVVKDDAGQPIANAVVELSNLETGRRYQIKTDGKGKYFSLGVVPGIYKVVLTKDKTTLWTVDKFQIRIMSDEIPNVLDIDIAKEKQTAVADSKTKMSEEEKKEMARVDAENAKIGNLNSMLSQARAAETAGNLDQAIALYKQATQADPSRDLLWARLGDANLAAARKETDRALQKEKYTEAAIAYKKAVELATAPPVEGAPKKNLSSPDAQGAYFNNLAEALGKSGDVDGAAAAYQKAAELNPPNAGAYYYNLGATMTNNNRVDQAIAAYDKSIEADPTRAEAYYQKGLSLLNKATMKGNEIVAPPGTAEAFKKYLELQPEGQNAEAAKQMLQTMGEKIETSYGKKKGPAKK